jgi:hypothetical protein
MPGRICGSKILPRPERGRVLPDLSPGFMKDLGWAKHEKSLELGELLKENSLRDKEGEPLRA